MKQYLKALRHVVDNGVLKENRTGMDALSVFGYQMRFDLSKRFPLLTTKRLHTKSIITELLWMISGSTSVKFLQDNGVSIWNEWADENGDLGPVYGHQWRFAGGVDQLQDAVDLIRDDPNSRRIIVDSWNPVDVDSMALPPCHCLFQFSVTEGKLSCSVYQRSADIFLGVPFNIAFYGLLTHAVEHITGLAAGELIFNFGDLHLYHNHLDQANLQLTRKPTKRGAMIGIGVDVKELMDLNSDTISLQYLDPPHPHIAAPIAI